MKILRTTIVITSIFWSFFSFSITRYVTNTNDSGAGSLRNAITSSSNGDVVEIVSSLIASNSDTIKLSSNITIDNDITVRGPFEVGGNKLYLSGMNTSRVFLINNSSTVILDSLNFVYSRDNVGGAILVSPGFLTVRNCSFKNCRASSGNGGAIHGATITISNSVFEDNNSASSADGGAVSGGTLNIINSIFSNNSANNGGAITGNDVTINNSTLEYNNASDYGGAIFSTQEITVIRSTLNNNNASQGGGALCTSKSTSSSLATSLYSYIYITASTLYANSSPRGSAIRSYLYATNNSAHYTSALIDIKYSTIMDFSSSSYPTVQAISDDNADIKLTSSILSKTSGTTVVNQYESQKIISYGYNILSDSVTGTSSTDQLFVTSSQLDLGPLAFNGGDTKTALPSFNSVAYNSGNTSGVQAQNGSVLDTREVGAAEIRTYLTEDVRYACDSLIWIDGNTYYTNNTSAKDTLLASNGLDSIISLNLTIQSSYSIVLDTICSSDSLFFNGEYISVEGQYFDTLTNIYLCDSVIEFNLKILPTAHTQLYDTIYSFDSVLFDGNYIKTQGDYYDTLPSTNGCDSIITLSLEVIQATINYVNDTICNTDSVFFDNQYIKTQGTYSDTVTDAFNNVTITTLYLVTEYCPVYDSCSGIFISEYIEGSSNNKALELYNPTLDSIDLSNYEIKKYINGDTTGTAITLTGKIGGYSTYVIAHSSADALILSKANLITGSLSFNGNDAISLERNDTLVDLIGVIGQDPVTQWGNGTQDHTLIRKSSVVGGVKLNPSSFDPADEWNIMAIDEFSYLGNHTSSCMQTTQVNTLNKLKANIYPNPAQDYIKISANNLENFSYSIYSVNGSVISKGVSKNNSEIDVSELRNGVYILSLTSTDGKILNKQLVINK